MSRPNRPKRFRPAPPHTKVHLLDLNFSNTELAELVTMHIKINGPIQTWFGKLLAGVIAQFLIQFTDEEWVEMGNASMIPCGIEGCRCEIFCRDQWEGLDKLREDCLIKLNKR